MTLLLKEKCVYKKGGSTKKDGDCEEEESCKEEKEKCIWSTNHEDKISLKEKGEIRKLLIVDAQRLNAAGLGVTTWKNNAKVEDWNKKIERNGQQSINLDF